MPVVIDHPGHRDLSGARPNDSMSWGEEVQFRKVRADLDRVIQANRVTLDSPQVGETPQTYERRVIRDLMPHATSYSPMKLDKLPAELFRDIKRTVVAEAMQAPARRGELVPITFRDAVGRQTTEFEGRMSCWMGQFRGPALATGICIDGRPQRF
ncbi:hypothetical protein [Paraburkholderia sp. BCC1884]|uniref:hypothetical protein n=1 Tax=Paraburkholderia sp. BCC1884 TaxID=2562668 RepID=UPI001183CDFD|nr:hypothetical protein [Paraburkholderia sp. BCC1884]